MLLRKILKTKISCPKEALYLECGAMPIGILIKNKRINYLSYLVREEKSTMLSKFFYAQWTREVKNDWTTQVRLDLNDLGIPEDLEFIRGKSNASFKRLVKVKAEEYALNELNLMKAKHKKMENIIHT